MSTTNLERRGGDRSNVAPTCKGTNRTGKPCRSTALGPNGFCSMHGDNPRLSARELGKKGAKQSAITRREQGKSLRQRIADELDREARKVVAVYLEAMEAEQIVAGKEGPVALGPDHALRVRAADSAINQAHGKPLQPVAQGGKTIVIVHPLISEAKTIQVDGDQVIELPADQVREIE